MRIDFFTLTQQEFEQEKDLLNGDISRICVTDNLDELCLEYSYARKRLERIFRVRHMEISNKKSCAAAAEADYVQQELFSQDK